MSYLLTQALALLEEATSYTSCETWSPSLTDEINSFVINARAAMAATAAPVEPHVWLYDFMDGTTTVRNWSTTNKAEAFAPGNFNQRGYVPVEN